MINHPYTRNLIFLLLLIGSISFVMAQGTTLPSAALDTTPDGYHCIRVTNDTDVKYSVKVGYKHKFTNGDVHDTNVLCIIRPGTTVIAYKASRKYPTEELSDVKVLGIREWHD